MPSKKNITLMNIQKYELCLHAHDNKKTRTQYVIRVNESTIMQILQSKDKWLTKEVTKPEAKLHKAVNGFKVLIVISIIFNK